MFSLGFSSSLSEVVEGAPHVAQAASHNVVAPEHLLRAVLEAPSSAARSIFLSLAASDLDTAWNATWPVGLRALRSIPPMSPAANACLDFAAGAARLREASLVTTVDLIDMVLGLDDPGIGEFLERTGLSREGFTSARQSRSSHQDQALAASFALPVATPAPGAVGGVLARHPVLPFEISAEDGPIAQALRIASEHAAGTLDSADILSALQFIDPVPIRSLEVLAACAAAGPSPESGQVPVDLETGRVHVTTQLAYALGAALMLRDCYLFSYVRHELVVAGLLLTKGSRVRQAFEDVLLTGLTTTRSHIDAIAGYSYADLPAVVRSISHSLTAVLPPLGHDPYVSLANEHWDVRDAEPLDVLATLRRAFEADATERGALDSVLDRVRRGLGDDNGDVGFRTVALHGLWLGELARGDRRAAGETARRLHRLATDDLWLRRQETLTSWLPRSTGPSVAADGNLESHASALLRTTSPEQVLRRLDSERIQPGEQLIDEMARLLEHGARTTPFGAQGFVERTVALVATDGLARTKAVIRSPRLLSRVSAALNDNPSITTFSGLMQDAVAESDFERSADLIRNLESAPAPIEASIFENELLRLCVAASESLGSDHESRYLVRVAGAQNLVASKASAEEDREAANEISRYALSLLVTEHLCSSVPPGLVSPLSLLLRQWWQSATESHRETERSRTAGLLAVRIAAAALPRKDEFADLLKRLCGSADEVTDRWVRQVARTLGIPLPPPEHGRSIAPRDRAANHDALAKAVSAFNDAGAAAEHDLSLAALERLVAARDDLDLIARLGDIDAISMIYKCLHAVGRCTGAGDRLVTIAARLHSELCDLAKRRVTEPGGNWDEVVEAWASAARVADAPELEVRQLHFGLAARGYQRAGSYQERFARRSRLERAADALSRQLLAIGQHEAAAAVIEVTSDLGLQDLRSGWKPRPAAEERTVSTPSPIEGTFYGNPYTFAFVRRKREADQDGEWPSPWPELISAPLSSALPVLVVVPGRQGGHVLAIKEGECTGWPAPALNGDLARSLLPRFALEDGDRRAGIAALRDALPDDVHAWVSAQHQAAVMSRSWCVLTPVHAALLTEPDTGGPVLSYTTSLGRLADSIDAAHAWDSPPSRAVVVTDPHPSTMAAVWVSGGEYTALTAAASWVRVLQGPDAVPGPVLDAVASGPDVFHYGGPVHYLGLLLAYDTVLSGSAVRHLASGPTRVAVLAGGPTAFIDVRRDDETMVDAFSALGCPAVIGCLWQTDDLADSLLIDAFYRDAISSNWASLPASLQRAAGWLRMATWTECVGRLTELYGDQRPARPPDSPYPYADPRHWAGYICLGA
jgi:hypothetical protein